MRTRMIDEMLREVREKAEILDFPVEEMLEYKQVTEIISTDSMSFEDKELVRNIVKNVLFPSVRLDYDATFRRLYNA